MYLKTLRKVYLLLFLLCAIPMLALAQSGKIQGKVLDADNGEPLTGAAVIIQGTVKGAAVDLDGNYLILNVPPGIYTLEVRFIGYVTQIVQDVIVRTDLTTTQDFKLKTQTFEGEEVIVTAERPVVIKDLTSSESRVSSAEIEKMPVQELQDVVQLQAGVNVGDDGQIRIRGGRASEVSYVVDGIRVSDDYNRSQGLRIENQSVEELQVISGTFNAEHGQAMSGIVNVVTKAGGNNFKGRASYWVGDYLTGHGNIFENVPTNVGDMSVSNQYNFNASLEGPIIKDKLTFFASARKFKNEGWLKGYNAFSPHGAYQEDLPLDTDMSTYRTLYGENPDLSLPWFSTYETMVEGRRVLRFEDSGKRDSSVVDMNPYESINFMGNVQFNASKMFRFNVIASYGEEEGRGYDHANKLVPYGISSYYRDNNLVNFKTTITPSNTTYLTLNAARRYNHEESYLYKDPYDPRYFNYDNISTFGIQQPGQQYQFNEVNTNNSHYYRDIETYIFKAEVSSQVNDQHFVKAGVNFQHDILDTESFGLQPLSESEGIVIPDYIPESERPFIELGIAPLETSNHQKYTRKPFNFSAYIQDKIELENLIVNVGVRWDYFDANTQIAADPRDPDITNPTSSQNAALTREQREEIWWKDVSAKTQISPRLGIAYPIPNGGVLHFSYGYFFQMPQYSFLYDNSQILLPQSSGVHGIYGNPDLKPERSIQYEIGYKQEIFKGTAIEITGFYKDSRDYVSSGMIQSTYIPTVRYGTWINRDYANSKGMTLVLNQNLSRSLNFSLDYTYTRVEGSNSDPSAEFNAAIASGSTNSNDLVKLVQLLDWDRSHIINGVLFFSKKNFSANVIARYATGEPYTPSTPFLIRSGLAASQRNLVNTARLPNRFTVNVNLDRTFNIGGYDLRTFLNIFNILDTKLVNNVYADTGEPDRPLQVPVTADPGYLNSPSNYAEPRRIQFGVEVSF